MSVEQRLNEWFHTYQTRMRGDPAFRRRELARLQRLDDTVGAMTLAQRAHECDPVTKAALASFSEADIVEWTQWQLSGINGRSYGQSEINGTSLANGAALARALSAQPELQARWLGHYHQLCLWYGVSDGG